MSRYFLSSIALLALAIFALPAGAMVITEGYDYANGLDLIATETGGEGWRTAPAGQVGYFTAGLSTQPSQTEAFDYNWTNSYTGYTYVNDAKSLRNINGAGAQTGARYIDGGIDMDTAPDLYFSYVVRPDDTDSRGADGTNIWTNLIFRVGNSSTSNGRDDSALIQVTGSGQFKIAGGNGAGGEASDVTGGVFSEGTEYLIVGVIEFDNGVGTDAIRASVFTNGEDASSEPMTWEHAVTGATLTGTFDNVAYRINGESQVGSLRLGNSYEFVTTGVPEPASAALLSIAAFGLLGRRRA